METDENLFEARQSKNECYFGKRIFRQRPSLMTHRRNEHSSVDFCKKFLQGNLQSQDHLDKISQWTKDQKIIINQKKSKS